LLLPDRSADKQVNTEPETGLKTVKNMVKNIFREIIFSIDKTVFLQ